MLTVTKLIITWKNNSNDKVQIQANKWNTQRHYTQANTFQFLSRQMH